MVLAGGSMPAEVHARAVAVQNAYIGLWEDFLRNRLSVAGERALALLQILGTIPEGSKDADLWVTEADFLYIAGACHRNEQALLERALACYSRVLALPESTGNCNARRMRAETLMRLRRYQEAFDAFAELAPLPELAPFEELEAAPFRLRHDAALCDRLASLGRLPAEVAADAAEALRAVSKRVEVAPLPGGRQRWPRVRQLSVEDQADLRRARFGELLRICAPYPDERLAPWRSSALSLRGAGGVTGPSADPLSAAVDWAAARRAYQTEKIAIIDDFFTPDALEELWRFSRESPSFRTVRNGFLGAFPADGNVHPLILATAYSLERHMPDILAGHPLGLWWLFKYTEAGRSGIGIHADAAAVNMNIWLTPDEARKSGGGLDIYTELPPVEAGMMEINREFATEEDEAKFRDELLKAGDVRRVEYRRNRAAIFVSDLYHASEPFEFADCIEAPRVNLTFLFGDRAADRVAGAKPQASPLAAGDAEGLGVVGGVTGKRPLEETGWDLFD